MPEGPADQPWLQAIEPEYVDTAELASEGGGKTLCFSNASVSNPWRVTGFITMQQQVDVLTEEGVIGEFRVSDAADDDNKQISDIQAFVEAGDCDAIVISPSTTATLTPAVEAACESGKPVIVFDRGVNTDCMVTFIHPIGGYAYGADGAEFLVENLEPGSKVLALRILPGVDVLENRWAAADKIFSSRSSRSWVPSSPAATARRSRTSSRSTSSAGTWTASGWMPATAPSRPSRRSRTRASRTPSSWARTR